METHDAVGCAEDARLHMAKMNREKIRKLVLREDKEQYLSAQEYGKLTPREKKELKEVLEEDGHDADEYERHMKKLWPREVKMKPLQWRKR